MGSARAKSRLEVVCCTRASAGGMHHALSAASCSIAVLSDLEEAIRLSQSLQQVSGLVLVGPEKRFGDHVVLSVFYPSSAPASSFCIVSTVERGPSSLV